jgi:hypothetical protein
MELDDLFAVGFDRIPQMFQLSEFQSPCLDCSIHESSELSACFIVVHLPAFPVTQEEAELSYLGRVK